MSERVLRIGSVYGKRVTNMLARRKAVADNIRVPRENWKFNEGDLVEVVNGKGQGQRGTVLKNIYKKNKLIVEGINMKVRTQPAEQSRPGFFFKKESPIHYSNLSIVDPLSDKISPVKFTRDEAGYRVRVAKVSGAVLPFRVDLVDKPKVEFNARTDTPAEYVWEQTYKPKFLTYDQLCKKNRDAKKAAAAAAAAK